MAFVWEQRKLGKIVEVHNGKDYKHLEKGNIPVYGTGGYMLSVSESLSDTQDAIGIGRKGTIDKPYILRAPFWTVDTLFYCIPREENDLNFIFDIFQNINWRLMDESTGVPSLSKKSINNVKILVPNKKEQKQIGLYFNQLDHLITLHQRKRMLRKCFFSIDWEQRKLGDITESYSGGTPTAGKKEYYDGNIPFIRSGEISSDKTELFISEEGLNRSSAKMVKIGDILYALYGATSGEVSISKLKGAINQAILAIQPHQNYDSQFLMQWLRKSKENIIGTYLQGGQGNLSGNIVKELIIDIPTYEEQKEIGAYLKKLDHLITLHQCKSNFCKKNEVNAWEQRKFGSLLNEIREKTTIENEDTLLSCAIDGMYLNSELFSHFRGQSNIGYLKVKKNDLILSAQNLHLGNCNVNLRFEHGIISPAYKVYELVDCNPLFVQAWIKMDKTKDFFLKSSTEGASVCRKNILWEELYKQELVVPAIEEQTVIGTYFEQFDQLITLHQWECNINENTEGNDEKQRKPIKKLIISEGNLSLVDDMFLLHRMTFLVCNKYILLRLNVVKYKITIIIISNILYSIVSLLIIACYLIVINKQLIILIYVEISVVIIKGDDDYARIRS